MQSNWASAPGCETWQKATAGEAQLLCMGAQLWRVRELANTYRALDHIFCLKGVGGDTVCIFWQQRLDLKVRNTQLHYVEKISLFHWRCSPQVRHSNHFCGCNQDLFWRAWLSDTCHQPMKCPPTLSSTLHIIWLCWAFSTFCCMIEYNNLIYHQRSRKSRSSGCQSFFLLCHTSHHQNHAHAVVVFWCLKKLYKNQNISTNKHMVLGH